MAQYGGQRIADFSPLQNASLQQAQGFLGSFAPDKGMPLFGETGNALGQLLSGQGGAPLLSMDQANQTFNQQYANPAYRNFRLNTSPLLQEQFSGPGFWSTARANAVGDAAGDLGSQLEAQRAGYLWDTEQTNRALQEAAAGRMQQGVSQGMQYGMMPTQQNLANLQGTQGLFDFGSAEQQQQQELTDTEHQQAIREMWPNANQEEQQQLDNLLRKVQDDPGLLLRNRMNLEYQKRRQNALPKGVEQEW